MKKLHIIFLTILTIVLVSCENENESLVNKTNLLSAEEIKNIANEHNLVLDFVFNSLKSTDISKVTKKEDLINVLNRGTESYFSSTLNDKELIKKAVNLSAKEINNYLYTNNNIAKKNTNLSPINKVISNNLNLLNEKQIKLLKQCDEILSKFNGNNINLINESFQELKKLAKLELSEKDAQVILIASEVGIMSSIYWSENIEKWNNVLNNGTSNKIARKSWFSWSDVVGADVAGGVGAAVTTAIINAAPGAGQVAYGTAIVSTAAGASVGDAALQIWKKVF